MLPVEFAGTYTDVRGEEAIRWQITSSDRAGWQGRYEIRTVIRSVTVWGGDFDSLEPLAQSAEAAAALSVDAMGNLSDCVLTGNLPCTVLTDGHRVPTVVSFRLELRTRSTRPRFDPQNLTVSTQIDGKTFEVADYWFEDGILRLNAMIAPATMVCCATCLYSDYSPAGQGLMGMFCHRDAKEQYLAVRNKAEYFKVPVTETVPETYLCPEYEARVAGTGCRG